MDHDDDDSVSTFYCERHEQLQCRLVALDHAVSLKHHLIDNAGPELNTFDYMAEAKRMLTFLTDGSLPLELSKAPDDASALEEQ